MDTVNRRGLLLAFIPVVLSALIAGGLLYYLYVLKAPPPVVRIAADRTGSDIRELLEAVAKLAEAREDGLRVELVSSDDPAMNIQLLERGQVDFAAIPADAVTRPSFSLVANLFPDTYHVLVRADSGIHSVHHNAPVAQHLQRIFGTKPPQRLAHRSRAYAQIDGQRADFQGCTRHDGAGHQRKTQARVDIFVRSHLPGARQGRN